MMYIHGVKTYLFKVCLTLLAALSLAGCKDDRDTRDEVFYFVMPDRFQNGNVENDTGGIDGSRTEHGFDATDQSYYHGGDLAGLTQKLPYLKQLGVTSIWMTPLFKNSPVSIDGSSAGYHGYWIQDYMQIDPHLGTNDELRAFIALAHASDMKVFFDIVVNHTADVIRYDECHNPDGSYQDGVNTCVYRDTSQEPYTPFLPSGSENVKAPEWLNDTAYYNNRGDSSFSGESSLLGDFFGLDDLDTTDPVVVQGMIDIFKYWVSEYRINGFRLDTVKHVNIEFWQEWAPALNAHAESQGISNFLIFGEIFDGNPANVSRFTTEGELNSALDFGLYYAMRDVFANNVAPTRLADMFAADDYYIDADSNPDTLLTFISNHDVGRIGSVIRSSNPGETDEQHLARLQQAYALMYFGRGLPVIYYGDEQGFVGGNGDKANREDMMASQVASYEQDLIGTDATVSEDNFDFSHPMFTALQEYKQVLDAHPALRQGKQYTRYASSEPGIFAFSRVYDSYQSEYLVVMNTSTEERSVLLDSTADLYTSVFPAELPEITSVAGQIDITVPALSTVIYKAEELIQGPALAMVDLDLVEGQQLKGRIEVPVNVGWETDHAVPMTSVDFYASVSGGDFEYIGTDHNAPYRVFYDTLDIPDGEIITFRATATDQNGSSLTEDTSIEVGVAPGIEMFFLKPSDWGDDINIYYWNAGNAPAVDWPGVSMETLAEDWYRFQFPDGVTAANIIFNDGEGNQTSDLYREGDGCYSLDSDWVDVCDPAYPGITLTFEAPDTWGDNINLYYWNADPAPGVEWPGVAMENIVDRWFRLQLPPRVSSANVIFNDGEGNQTADLYREGDGCFASDTWQDSCDVPEPGIRVTFQKPDTWGDNVNIYYWNADPAGPVDWPGVPTTDLGNGIYEFQFPTNVRSANIIFNDGAGNQTADLFRDADGCFDGTSWIDSCETVAAGLNIQFVKPADWGTDTYIYYWAADPAPSVDWPGVLMSDLGSDVFGYQFPEGVTSANIIFTDGAGNQTADLFRDADGCFDGAAWIDSCGPVVPGFRVNFLKPDAWGDNINIYFWEAEPLEAIDWPGTPMLDLGSGWYTYDFPEGVASANVIFNDGNGNQTADLNRSTDGCYIDGAWVDTCDAPVPGLLLTFRKPASWGDAINVYFWNADPAPSPDWPGVAMEEVADGWYQIRLPAGATSANVIFNDGQGNQTADLFRDGDGCYGVDGDVWTDSCELPTQIEISGVEAHWVESATLVWDADASATSFELYVSSTASLRVDGNAIAGADASFALSAGSISTPAAEKFRHLAGLQAHGVSASDAEIRSALQGQLVVAAFDSAGTLLEATRVQTPGVIDELFATTAPLGVQVDANSVSVSVWAPTAQSLDMNVYDDALNLVDTIVASTVENGVYTFVGDSSWIDQYYRFGMTVYHPVTDAIESYEVTDPYSISLSANSQFSQIVDLDNDASIKPTGWDAIVKDTPQHKDISVYEGHVSDFSNFDMSVAAADRGKYSAFTYNGQDGRPMSSGMAHLANLQEAGLTHFHLLPVNDIATINEDPALTITLDDPYSRLCAMSSDSAVQDGCAEFGDRAIRDVFAELAAADPINTRIQAIAGAMRSLDGFNWGYDPYHFIAIEGGYASEANGKTRILEFREMVKSLHEIGLNVVVDVVFNHTNSSGIWDRSVLDRVVPGYYHRLNSVSGEVERSTCCDNTAAEHTMMGRLMADTIVLWAQQYKVDSFRFDLMGHHPKAVLEMIQAELANLTATEHGVYGDRVYLYGEGWDFGEVSGNQRFEQATQFNMGGTGVGTFNDRIRAAIRGGNFTDNGRSQGFANGNETYPNGVADGAGSSADQGDRIRIGLAGNLRNYAFIDNTGTVNSGAGYNGVGYTLDPQENMPYVDKHDNESLWDNNQAKLPDSVSTHDRVRVQVVSQAFINFAQGVPFHQMGSDILRSKSMDRNTYDSGDWANQVDFSLATNNWAKGLPYEGENGTRWTVMSEIMSNPNIDPQTEDLQLATDLFQEQLQIRYSSELFRLDAAEDVMQRVAFWNTGTAQTPGLVVMTVSDGACAANDLDATRDGVAVVFNTDDDEQVFSVGELAGTAMQLHEVQQLSADDVVVGSSYDAVSGTFTVPGRTAAVFTAPQSGAPGAFPCNPQNGLIVEPGFTVFFEAPADWAEVNIYYWEAAPAPAPGWPGIAMEDVGGGWYTYQFPDGVTSANIIFNNNAGSQTADLFRDGDGCYDIASDTWSDTCDVPGVTLQFVKPAEWGDDVHLYFWNAAVPNPGWPGTPMSDLGGGLFELQLPTGVRAANVIFNDNAGNQTSDLFRSSDGCYTVDGGWGDTCPAP